MADKKISGLTSLQTSQIGDDDLLFVVDVNEPIVSEKNKKLEIGNLFDYIKNKLEVGGDSLFLAQGFNSVQEGYFNVVHTNRLTGNTASGGSVIRVDDGISLSVDTLISNIDLNIKAGGVNKNVLIESSGTGSLVLRTTSTAGKIDLKAGEQGVRIFNSNQTNYIELNADNISSNRRLNFADGTTTLVSGTMVPTTRTLEILTENGLTGGTLPLDLTSNKSWTLGLTGQALSFHSLNTNGLITRTASNQITTRTIEVSGTGLSVLNGNGISGNPRIAINSTSDNTPGAVVSRNLLGDFTANTVFASLSGNASTATTWQTGRTIQITGDVEGTSSTFNGSENLSFSVLLTNTGVSAGTYTKTTVDTKGRVTAGTTLAASDIPTLTASKISDFNTQVQTNRLNQLAVPIQSVSLNNQRITNVADPVALTDAANKAYVDASQQGLIVKDAVRVTTQGNISLSGIQTIDTILLVSGDRILVKDQTLKENNGIYVVSSGAWSRAADANQDSEIQTGLFVFVEEGDFNANSGWVLSVISPEPAELGVSELIFAKFSGAGQIEAGTGLTKTGNTINLNTVNSNRIVANADNIDLAFLAVGGIYRSVTVDDYGRVTNGSNPTTLAGYGITDAASNSHTHGNITNDGRIGSTDNRPIITTVGGVLTTGSFGTTANTFCQGNDSRLSDARTPLSHSHGNITNDGRIGTTAAQPLITTTGGTITTGSFGSSSGTFCEGNDNRLSDARTPISHTHGNITNDGRIGSTSGLPIITGGSGVLTVGSFGTAAGTFCQGNDARLSDARTPLSHTHSTSDITSGTFNIARIPVGTTSSTVCVGNDSRLGDTRTPTDASVTDAKVASTANIAGFKINPNFGSQNLITTGTNTSGAFIPISGSIPSNGLYLPTTNTIGLATASGARLTIDASGSISFNSCGVRIRTGRNIDCDVSTSSLSLLGGANNGANIELYGSTHPTSPDLAIIDSTELQIRSVTGSNRWLTVAATGEVLIGTITSAPIFGIDFGAALQIEGNSTSRRVSINSTQNGTGGSALGLAHIRTAPSGSSGLRSGDELGEMFFIGHNGNRFWSGASIGSTLEANAEVAATELVASTWYKITSVATTDFTLVGASANTVGTIFQALGVGTGTGRVSLISNVTAGAFVVGSTYTITSVGTTNFTLVGASANTVGTKFVASGVGTGTGTAGIDLARMPANLIFKTRDTGGDITEKARISNTGALLVGTSNVPTGSSSGAVVAQNRVVINSTGAGLTQIISGALEDQTAASGYCVFNFKSLGFGARACFVQLTVSQRANSNIASNSPAAVYAFQLHQSGSTNACSINGSTTVFEYTYIRENHLQFQNLGNGECAVALINPTNATLRGAYKVEILSTDGIWSLNAVATV